MSNPYQPPTEQPENRSARPWMILSAVLLSAVLFLTVAILGVILWRSMPLRRIAMEKEQQAKAQAVMARQKANDALQKAEAASANE